MRLFMYSRDYLSLHPLITFRISKHKWIKGCICDGSLIFIHLSYLIFLYSKVSLKITCYVLVITKNIHKNWWKKSQRLLLILYMMVLSCWNQLWNGGIREKTKAEYNLDLIEYRVYWRREKSSSFGFVGFRWTLKFINHSIQTQNNH